MPDDRDLLRELLLSDNDEPVRWPWPDVPPTPHGRRLMEALGVVGMPPDRPDGARELFLQAQERMRRVEQGEPVTTAAERMAKGARMIGNYAGAAPEKAKGSKPTAFADEQTLGRAAAMFRESRARVIRRVDAGDDVLTCPDCGTELDVALPAHDTKCSRYVRAAAAAAAEGNGGGTDVPPKGLVKSRDGKLRSAKERDSSGALTSGELERRHEAKLDAALTVSACAWCSWTFTGTAADGREAAAAHRLAEHPDRLATKKNGRRVGTTFPPREVDDAERTPDEITPTSEEEPMATIAAPAPTAETISKVGWPIHVNGTGLKYRSVDEALVAADEIEADGERVARDARFDGQEGKADQAVDAARELAAKIRAAAEAFQNRGALGDPGGSHPRESGQADAQPLPEPGSPSAPIEPEWPRDRQPWSRELILSAIQKWHTTHGRAPTTAEWIRRGDDHPAFSTAAKMFGSWSAAVRAAGLEPNTSATGTKSSVRAPKAPEKRPSPPASPEAAEEGATASPPPVLKESPTPAVGIAERGARTDEPGSSIEVAKQEVALSEPTGSSPTGSSEAAEPPAGAVSATASLDAQPGTPGGSLSSDGGGFNLSLALTGNFAHDALRVRAEASKLRAQAEALDVIATGIDQLAETIA